MMVERFLEDGEMGLGMRQAGVGETVWVCARKDPTQKDNALEEEQTERVSALCCLWRTHW